MNQQEVTYVTQCGDMAACQIGTCDRSPSDGPSYSITALGFMLYMDHIQWSVHRFIKRGRECALRYRGYLIYIPCKFCNAASGPALKPIKIKRK